MINFLAFQQDSIPSLVENLVFKVANTHQPAKVRIESSRSTFHLYTHKIST